MGLTRSVPRWRVKRGLVVLAAVLVAINIQASASPTRFMNVQATPVLSVALVALVAGAYYISRELFSPPN